MSPRLIKAGVVLCLIVIAIGLAPYYLIVSERPVESDAVVLFLGPDNTARRKQADQILKDGLSKYLLIPGSSKYLHLLENGELGHLNMRSNSSASPTRIAPGNKKTWQIEDTHRETLLARDIMDRMGLSSANFVSSPYHLRRIKIIAGRVFDDHRYRIAFIAAGDPDGKPYLWWTSKDAGWWVTREYAKIIWFLIYEPFM